MAVVDVERLELLEATDEQIERAVSFADPMVLRGLLYQLTGDESLAEIPVGSVLYGWVDVAAVTDPDAADTLRARAVEFLKSYRDSGAGEIEVGPVERLGRSLALTVGVERIPDEDTPYWVEELALDPYGRGLEWEEAPPPEQLKAISVVVIGAGIGGLNAAAQLAHAGIEYTILERNSGVGGTWWENRYPGARVDSPSRGYQHILGSAFKALYPFCPQEENARYFDWVADAFGLRDRIEFDTEVSSLVWDDEAAEWVITASTPQGARVWRANAVISAVGVFNQPNLPEIEGADSFRGRAIHTSRWPDDLELEGKRFAVIGTGCTGYQMTPVLAKSADHVYLFQRTAQWLFDIDGYLSPYPDEITWLDRNFPFFTNFMRFVTLWYAGPEIAADTMHIDPTFEDPHTRSASNQRIRQQRIEFLERKLAGRPDLVEKMLPEHPPFSARPVLCDKEYSVIDTLLQGNVTLVTEGIDRITPEGILTKDGTTCEVDVILYATGFQASDYLWPMEVRGKDGRRVEDLWAKDGPRAYLGSLLPGFPNLFMVYGPNTNAYGGGGVVALEEIVTTYALQCLRHLIVTGSRSLDVTEEAYWRYNAALDEEEARMMYSDPRANNYFRNEHGRSSTNCPFPNPEMWRWLQQPNLDDLIVR